MEVRNAEDQGHPLLYWLHKKFEASLVSKKKEEKKKSWHSSEDLLDVTSKQIWGTQP